MPHRYLAGPLLVCCTLSAMIPCASAQQRSFYQQTEYKGQEIGKLTGDVYYARMDDYVSVFMVTPDGIILVEPIGTEFATWLKGELNTRFHVPVKYVIYSHSHWDHASGGAVYADTARFIGHENMLKNIALPPASTPLPANLRAQDTNGNGKIEPSEAQGNMKAMFSLYDVDKDGSLSGAEIARGPIEFVRAPDITYTDRLNLHLGGKLVEVIWKPTGHADDNTIVRFVDGTNVLFASDWITVHRLPFGPISPDEIDPVKAIEAMDFEYFVCSHGKLGKKADVTASIRYREQLRDAVAKAVAAGETLQQAQAGILMEDYKDWEFYDAQRPQNVAGTYRALTRKR
ncbi:MAG TPA: MBL fold metallo-hydrolase [Bryobacteraceae bacterium]|jgi:glyoxylase-like metal-dependent hydrolase (beta-lactamase superfamily II)|nr:MBL fold metallo-hydrolase [Bryobacteraceae bacterium]